jgi:IS605 OrfB family transposase
LRCLRKQYNFRIQERTEAYELHNRQAQKAGLHRAIGDAAWGELKQKVKQVAAKSGVLVHEINPKHTSQECRCCGYISPTATRLSRDSMFIA